jgi:hypothetical protein
VLEELKKRITYNEKKGQEAPENILKAQRKEIFPQPSTLQNHLRYQRRISTFETKLTVPAAAMCMRSL